MNDRELLEAAARAAGIQYDYWSESGMVHLSDTGHWYPGCEWNPLDDDGDAFRLAVQLHITVKPFFSCIGAVTDKNFEGDGYALIVPDCDRDDADKRTKYMRYAIVSAAAGISRSIP